MFTGTVDPIDIDVREIINEDLSPKAMSAAIADFARTCLAEAETENSDALGFVPQHTTTVDGVVGAGEDQVRPDGTILYAFHLLPDVFSWILQELESFAPVRSGRFKASFELYADGQLIDPNGEVPQAQEYVFVSSAAYALEIEGDQTRAPESRQAPSGVFDAVAVLAQQHFDGQANISFAFRAPLNSAISSKITRTPAIIITMGS